MTGTEGVATRRGMASDRRDLAGATAPGSLELLAFPAEVARVGRMLSARSTPRRGPEQVNLPGFYWHPLQGGEARWAIRVTGNWRITFAWDGADAVAVDLEDYH
jgi:toxin HigB-1